ncbi:hypothetical protein [Tenacibaculum sp. 190524A02b]|uniref:Uncharacterized protein n=1 Tax=Tenacibaculum vairaonense TaxID=3137860 RepID=A0ABM9PNA8_9FLAO
MKETIKKNAQVFPVSYLYMEINKFEVSNEGIVTYVKSDIYQTNKFSPAPYYKEIDFL